MSEHHDCCAVDPEIKKSMQSPGVFLWAGVAALLAGVLFYLVWQAANPLPGFWK